MSEDPVVDITAAIGLLRSADLAALVDEDRAEVRHARRTLEDVVWRAQQREREAVALARED